MFDMPGTLEAKAEENLANAICGAFLLPKSDLERELGMHRTAISKDMLLVCMEYAYLCFYWLIELKL